ncbi:MAG TPA: dockerin type I domain-containing protein [Phycisphaerae bacterium]|nr:dockerin type I domain-containing protein [Phycisphaerae bacterium]HRW51870.1 dockerin type I domain-containing protein [Phycisphaerae bacterium]
MGRFARKTTWLVGLALASLIANTGCGCDLSDFIGFPIPVGSDSVLVIIENEAGVEVRADATFTFSSEDVRKTSRVLDADGAGASVAILRTVAERIDVRATAIGGSPSSQVISNLITPGEVLLDVTLRLNIDYSAGDTIVIRIQRPFDDCNNNGRDDAEEIALGDAHDCDENGIPDDCQPDVDNDGVPDACDNCLSIPNPDQRDDDNNNLGDVCETGACQISVTCVETTLTLCLNQGGIFDGVGTNCGAGNPVPTGACCTGLVCNITTQAICEAAEGTYQGDTTTCDSASCLPPTGACCAGEASCLIRTQLDCIQLEGTYFGDNTICETDTCLPNEGACCLEDLSGPFCVVLSGDACDSAEGSYLGDGSVCDFDICQPPTGACCLPNVNITLGQLPAICVITSELECANFDGAYQGDDTSCDSDPCNPPTGACCFNPLLSARLGACSVITEDECLFDGGTYLGDDTTCDNDPCSPPTGACCFYDGETTVCLVNTEVACESLNGYYHGDDTSCAFDTCEPIVGACCLTSFCVEIPEPSCTALMGVFSGVETECPGACFATGACCYGSFCSSELTQDTCEIEGGTYLGDNSTCDGEPCGPPTGACCLYNDTCMDLTELSCNFMKGTFLSYDLSCASVACDQPLTISVTSDRDWIYENIPSMSVPPTNCGVTLTAMIDNDPLNNSSYTITWTTSAPIDNPSAELIVVSGEGTESITYRAPDRPGYSPHGFTQYIEVFVFGNDFGNYGYGYAFIDVRVLGDVDGSGCTDAADRAIITNVIDGEITNGDLILAADVNCDGSVDALDSQTVLFVEQDTDGNGSGACGM